MAGPAVINGFFYDFSNIFISIRGFEFGGITSISYSIDRDPQAVYGNGDSWVRGWTQGQIKCEASFEMTRNDWDYFQSTVSSGCGQVLNEQFDVVVNYVPQSHCLGAFETNPPPVGTTVTDILYGCSIKKLDFSGQAGNDVLKVKCDLVVSKIALNKILPAFSIQVGFSF